MSVIRRTRSRAALVLSSSAAAVALFATAAQAQSPLKPAASAAAPSPAAASAPVRVDPEKQKLIDRLLLSWHPESAVVGRVQAYAENTLNQARAGLEQARLPPEKIDADLKEMVPDIQKYIDQTRTPLEASIKKNTGPAVSAMLASQFSIDELKQLVTVYESPLTAKFGKMQPDLGRAVGERVQADIGAQVSKNIEEMSKAVGTKLRTDIGAH